MTTHTIDQPRTLLFDHLRRVRTRMIAGRINVVGTDGEPRLEVTRVGAEPVIARHDGDELELIQEGPQREGWLSLVLDSWKRPRPVEISVAVPRDCAVDVELTSGNVVLSGTVGPANVRVTSGDVILARLGGPVEAHLVSGPVHAQSVSGDLRVRTYSGNLTLAEVSGDVRAHTASGHVTLDLDETARSTVDLSTTSGDISVRAPHEAEMRVLLTAVSGEALSAFSELRHDDWPGRHRVEGTLGTGAGLLRASTTCGTVALLRRRPDPDTREAAEPSGHATPGAGGSSDPSREKS